MVSVYGECWVKVGVKKVLSRYLANYYV